MRTRARLSKRFITHHGDVLLLEIAFLALLSFLCARRKVRRGGIVTSDALDLLLFRFGPTLRGGHHAGTGGHCFLAALALRRKKKRYIYAASEIFGIIFFGDTGVEIFRE